MSILATVAQGSVYNVTINDVSVLRRQLTITLDEGDGTLAVSQGATVLIPATLYSDIEADEAGTGFASYEDLAAWVAAYMTYNIVAVVAVDAAIVEINGLLYERKRMFPIYDTEEETISVTIDGNDVIINRSYDEIYPDGSETAFVDFAALQTWVIANLAANVHVAALNDFAVIIDDESYQRSGLTVTLDGGTETLTAEFAAETIIDAVIYSSIYEGESSTTFASYAAMAAWVNTNMVYNAVIVEAVSTTQVKIAGVTYTRADLEVTTDDEAGTITVTDGEDTLIDAKVFSLMYLQGSITPFASFAELDTWQRLYLQYNVFLQVDSIYQIWINGTLYDRDTLDITSDEAETLTVVDTSGEEPVTLIDTWPYDRIFIVGAETPLFATYADMVAWIIANMNYNVVTVEASELNEVIINESPTIRDGLVTVMNENAGTLLVNSVEGEPLINTLYSNIVPDGGEEGFATFADMVDWVNQYLVFRGQSFTKSALGSYQINHKPFAKNLMYLAWDDVNETLEIRHSHYDLSDKPLQPTKYDQIAADGSTTGFNSYAALIDYVSKQFFYP